MRSWGFTVLEAAGCDTQSASSRAANPGGLFIEHHDASSALSGNWGALATILAGRVGIPPRLGNLQFARDGKVMICSKNVANHAGIGGPMLGVAANDANANSCGAEVANNGLGEPYSPALTRAIIHGEAAWAIVNGKTAEYVRGHKEWAGPRKSDPRLDMNARRAAVAAIIRNAGPDSKEYDDMPITQDEIERIAARTRDYLATSQNPWGLDALLGRIMAIQTSLAAADANDSPKELAASLAPILVPAFVPAAVAAISKELGDQAPLDEARLASITEDALRRVLGGLDNAPA